MKAQTHLLETTPPSPASVDLGNAWQDWIKIHVAQHSTRLPTPRPLLQQTQPPYVYTGSRGWQPDRNKTGWVDFVLHLPEDATRPPRAIHFEAKAILASPGDTDQWDPDARIDPRASSSKNPNQGHQGRLLQALAALGHGAAVLIGVFETWRFVRAYLLPITPSGPPGGWRTLKREDLAPFQIDLQRPFWLQIDASPCHTAAQKTCEGK